jgi:hypothetical protein
MSRTTFARASVSSEGVQTNSGTSLQVYGCGNLALTNFE